MKHFLFLNVYVFLFAAWFEPIQKQPNESKPTSAWNDINNRRRFFEEFAASMGFDATKPDNWRYVTTTQIIAKQVVSLDYPVHKTSTKF